MSHDPIAADIGTQVSDNALHGVTAGSTALTSVTGLVPAGPMRSPPKRRRRSHRRASNCWLPMHRPKTSSTVRAKRSRTSPAPIRKSTTAPPASSPNRPPTHRRE